MLIIIKLVFVLNNTVFIFALFVLFCRVTFVIIQQYFLFVRFPVLRFSIFESLIVVIIYVFNFFCYFFVGFTYVYCLFTKVQLCSVLCSVVEVLFSFLYLSILVMFLKCSLCILICECMCLFLSSLVVCSFFDTLQLLLIATI